MLIQFITDGKEVYVLEFSARTGGGTKYLRIKTITGFDVIKAVVDLTLGKKPHVDEKERKNIHLADEFIYCKNGTFDHLEGFKELKDQGVLTDYYIFKWKGAEFDGVNSSGDRVGGFTIIAPTLEELSKKHDYVAERIKVIGENGEDIMRHDLLTEIPY